MWIIVMETSRSPRTGIPCTSRRLVLAVRATPWRSAATRSVVGCIALLGGPSMLGEYPLFRGFALWAEAAGPEMPRPVEGVPCRPPSGLK